MYERLINPLKVRLGRKEISPEEAVKELRAMIEDEFLPVAFRARVSEELAPTEPPSPREDSRTAALREALRQRSEKLRRDAAAMILDRITETPALRDLRASLRHTERVRSLQHTSMTETPPSSGNADESWPPDSSSEPLSDREKRYAKMTVVLKRQLGKSADEVKRLEELLGDARVWAEVEVERLASEGHDLEGTKKRVVKKTFDDFIPRHRYHCDFDLGYEEFAAALWEEGWPSLENLAKVAIENKAGTLSNKQKESENPRVELEDAVTPKPQTPRGERRGHRPAPQVHASGAPLVESDSAKKQTKRGKTRSAWLDEQITLKQWSSDTDIATNSGPTYNTIQRYRSGEKSTRETYVRGRLAKAFGCLISEVPE